MPVNQKIKKLEQALEASEAKYRELFEYANIGIFQSTPDGKVISVNPAFAQMFGYESPEDVLATVNNAATDVFADPQRRAEIIRLQAENPELNTFENIYRRKDGSLFTGLLNTRHESTKDGQSIFWGFIQDITNTKRSLEKLRQSEQRFQSLIEKAVDVIAVLNAEAIVQFVSPSIEAMIGYQPGETLGRNILEWIHPDDIPAVMDALASRTRIPGTAPASIIARCRHKNGEWRMIEALGTNLFAEPAVQGLVLNIRDVTAQNNVEQSLRESEEKWRAIVNSSPDFIALHDAQGRFLFLNHYADGFSEKDVTGHSAYEFIAPESQEIFKQNQEACLKTMKPQRFEYKAMGDNGVIRTYEQFFGPIIKKNGEVNIIAVARDITERKQADDILQKRTDEISLLYEASQALSRTLNLDELYQEMNRLITKVMPCDGLFISAYEQQTGLIRCVFGVDEDQQVLDVSNFPPIPLEPEGHGIQSQVIRTGKPWLLNDFQGQMKTARAKYYVDDDGQIVDVDSIPADADVTRSGLILPILLEGQVVGVLQVLSYRLDAYSQDDLKIAEALAAQFSAASSNALLYQKAQLEIIERTQTEKRINESEVRYRSLFEDTPVALLEEDFSGARQILEALKHAGVIDFETYLPLHPEVVAECAARVKVLDVNRAALELFKAEKKEQMITDLTRLLDKDSIKYFTLELVNVASGCTKFEWEGSNKTIDGQQIFVNLNWSVAPGYEESLSKVIVSLVDITERKRAEQERAHTQSQLQAILDYSPDLISIKDLDGNIVLANQSFDVLDAPPLHDLIGQNVFDVFPQDVAAKLWKNDLAALHARGPVRSEEVVRHKDGNWHTYMTVKFPIHLEADHLTGICAISTDITERKLTEDALRRQNAYLAALQKTMLELISLHDLNVLLENIVRRAGQLVGTDAGYLDLVEPGADQLKTQVGLGAMAESLKFSPKLGEGVAGKVWKTGQTLAIDDYDAWEGRIAGFSQEKIRAIIGIPLLSEDQILGILGLAYPYPSKQTFGPEEIELLTQFARLATLAIENTRVFAELQRELLERKQVETALRKSEASTRSIYQSMAEMLALHEIIYDLSGKAIDYRILDCNTAFSTITGISPGQAIGALASQLYDTDEAPYLDLYARVAESGETIHFETFFAPLKKNFSISAFSPEKGRFATISTDITQRKAAEAEISRHLSELEVLYENSLAISRLLEPKQIGQKLIETLSKKLAWHHAAIRVIQPENGKLELLAYGQPGFNNAEIENEIGRLNQLVTDSGKGLSGWVTKYGKPVRSGQVKKDERYLETYPGIQSGLYVPIRAGERTIGSIAVESEQEDAFSEQDQRLLTTIASQAAISIQNAQLFSRVQQELAAREQAEQALLEAHADLEHRVVVRTAEVQDLYDNAPCGYHSLDANGKYAHINQTELDWLGYELDEIIGCLVRDFLSESSKAMFAELFPAFKKSGVLRDTELEFVRKDGTILTMLVNATAIYDEVGTYKMSRSTLLDISRRKLAEEALRESESHLRRNRDELSAANTALEKAARMKDEFLASMSHELRTPLTGILGLSEALQLSTYGDLSEKQLKALKNIESSGRHLLELINDILDLSKIEAGKFDMQMEQCSLIDICRASLQLAKGMAQQKHQNVSFSMHPDSIYLRADARRLKQMLVNLLGNAVKFTPEGGSIGLEIVASESEQRVKLTVWDDGIGIKAEDMQNLFKPFVQLDSRLSRQYSGTGLGLSLVHRMAELQGGSVEVKSVPAAGSRFTIILPWGVQGAESGNVPTRGISTMRQALTIEDSLVDAEQVARYLQNLEIINRSLSTAQDALEQAAYIQPDVIILNLHLPDNSGWQVLAELKTDERTHSIPVIIMSVEEDRAKAFSLGAAGYLVKPFTAADLRMELERANNAPTARIAPVKAIGQSFPVPRILLADDNENNLEMLSDFLENRHFQVISTRSGGELLERAPEFHADLMLIDIQMPVMDGLETIRRIRTHPDASIAATPIIAITALAMPGDRERCLAAGANDYLSKPLQLVKLVDVIRELLQR